MEEKDFLKATQRGDEAAFRALFSKYAEPTYRTLLQRCGDKALARTLLKRVFEDVSLLLREQTEADPTALWINALASRHMEAHLFYQKETDAVWQTLSGQSSLPQEPRGAAAPFGPAPMQTASAPSPAIARPANKRGGKAALLCVLLAMTACILWAMAGFLMNAQVLPRIDLGYEWFNTAVFQLF